MFFIETQVSDTGHLGLLFNSFNNSSFSWRSSYSFFIRFTWGILFCCSSLSLVLACHWWLTKHSR